MTDVLTKKQRSYNMSRIKPRNTKPEVRLRSLLFETGAKGFRLNSDLPGKPDIVFPKKKLAVFIDGCFWHKCPKCFVRPATRTSFWMKKINGNAKRDRKINRILRKAGWRVLRIREHRIRKNPDRIVALINHKLNEVPLN